MECQCALLYELVKKHSFAFAVSLFHHANSEIGRKIK